MLQILINHFITTGIFSYLESSGSVLFVQRSRHLSPFQWKLASNKTAIQLEVFVQESQTPPVHGFSPNSGKQKGCWDLAQRTKLLVELLEKDTESLESVFVCLISCSKETSQHSSTELSELLVWSISFYNI